MCMSIKRSWNFVIRSWKSHGILLRQFRGNPGNTPVMLCNTCRTLHNIHKTLRNTPETLRNTPETLRNTPGTLRNTPVILCNACRSLRNTPETFPVMSRHARWFYLPGGSIIPICLVVLKSVSTNCSDVLTTRTRTRPPNLYKLKKGPPPYGRGLKKVI